MSDQANIVEFLKNGNLGQLHLGMSIEDTVAYLGAPDGFTTSNFAKERLHRVLIQRDTPDVTPLFYGCMELIFEREQDTLISIKIQMDEQTQRRLPASLNDDWLAIIDGMSTNEVIQFLDNHLIEWSKFFEMPGVLMLITRSGCVTLTIDLEDGMDVLYSMIKSKFNLWGILRASDRV